MNALDELQGTVQYPDFLRYAFPWGRGGGKWQQDVIGEVAYDREPGFVFSFRVRVFREFIREKILHELKPTFGVVGLVGGERLKGGWHGGW